MSEMVERVARAMQAADARGETGYRAVARVAIEAMREATPEMIEEGRSEMRAAGGPEFVWRAMIDAALTETP